MSTHVRGSLSPRETEVLGLIALGYTSARIAAVLGLSPSTVVTQANKILVKLHVHTRAHAVAVAIHRGLIPGGAA